MDYGVPASLGAPYAANKSKIQTSSASQSPVEIFPGLSHQNRADQFQDDSLVANLVLHIGRNLENGIILVLPTQAPSPGFVSSSSVAIASSSISSCSTDGKLSRSGSGSDSRNVKVETPIGFPIS
jgi:hypothetical protein